MKTSFAKKLPALRRLGPAALSVLLASQLAGAVPPEVLQAAGRKPFAFAKSAQEQRRMAPAEAVLPEKLLVQKPVAGRAKGSNRRP